MVRIGHHVAGCEESIPMGWGRGRQRDEVSSLTDEMLPPDIKDVGLKRSSRGAIIVQARDTTVDLFNNIV